MKKRTKALNPTKKIKEDILDRDMCNCIHCGNCDTLTVAHYISKSQGGLGIPQNLGLLCMTCHHLYDNGNREDRRAIGKVFREYLQDIYPDWKEGDLYYKKEF